MEHSPDGTERDGTSGQPGLPGESQVMLAEYSALRAEIDRRANVQWNVLALQVTSAGAVAGLVLSTSSDPALLLIVPLFSYMFGSRYILHDFHIKLIQQYFRDSLSSRLQGSLQWERWKADTLSTAREARRFRVTGWNVVHPTRLAFEGVAALALTAAPLAAVYRWSERHPRWELTLGFALLWAVGMTTTYLLHRNFDLSSGADAVSRPGTP
jgi:hypothetical protein